MNARRTIVHLVHGTWPAGGYLRHRFPWLFRPCPGWFEPASDFRAAIETHVTDVEWHVFRWSGENSELERRRAARDFCENLKNEIDAASDACHVVIAHSHGGNVALWALGCLDDGRRNRVAGLATLGTPFLHFRPRTLSPLEARVLTLLLSARFLLWFPLVIMPTALLALVLDSPALDARSAAPYVLTMLMLTGVYFVLHYLGLSARERLRQHPAGPRELPRALALRCRGDEAARAIAAADKAAALLLRAWVIVRAYTRLVRWDDARWRRRGLWAAAGVSLLLIGLACAQALLLPERFAEFADGMAHEFPRAWVLQRWPGVAGLLVLESMMYPLLVGQIAAIVAFMPPIIAAPIVYYSQVFLGSAFGADTLHLAIATEIRADATPPYPSMTVEYIELADGPSAHSVHAIPAARRRLADWIGDCHVPSSGHVNT